MTVRRKQVDIYATLVMTSLCIVWGIQQVAIKGIADEISPVQKWGCCRPYMFNDDY